MKGTFGIEVEGAFMETLFHRIERLACSYHGDIEAKYDGSVHVNKDECYMDEQEIAVGVFSHKRPILRITQMLSNEFGNHYLADETCGIHLHYGPTKQERLNCLSLQFLADTEEFAKKNLCRCTRKRLSYQPNYLSGKTNFCRRYPSGKSFASFMSAINDFKLQNKYRSVRNHPQGTLEFRFFSACEHVHNNISLFLEWLEFEIDTINKKGQLFRQETGLDEPALSEINLYADRKPVIII